MKTLEQKIRILENQLADLQKTVRKLNIENSRREEYDEVSYMNSGYYSLDYVVKIKGYSSVQHLSENYNIFWFESKDGIVWNVESK